MATSPRQRFLARRERPSAALRMTFCPKGLAALADRLGRSPLLRHSLGRSVRRQRDPRVACLLPNRDGRRWEIRVGEVAYGNRDHSREAFVLPVHGGAAGWTEIESQRVVAFGRAPPRRRFAPMVICSRWNRAWLLMTAPVRRWHSRQWHMEMRDGSPSIVRWSCPQQQAARRVVMGQFRCSLR
jgi:hypothetical protein